ncbi:ATP-binding protein [Phenylobacterium sp.]|uniref:hybrid sensor histidine kinase/response regulator n=1 Tax=Phenylobacterium sp. TaxID=1871053 RepID=UPI003D2934AB
MTVSSAVRQLQDESGSFQVVLRRRVRAHLTRAGEAGLVGALSWLATGNNWVGVWFAVTLAAGLIETIVSRRALAAADPWIHRRSAAAAQSASAVIFASLAGVIIMTPTATALCGACFLLCAVSLANALKASGSRLAMWALVPPPAVGLIAAPLWVGFAGGTDVPLGDTLLMAVGGVGYTIFIVRAAMTLAAERSAMRAAMREAEAGRHRWRQVFHHSPMARVCFNAEKLYASLKAAARGRTRLGDVLLELYPTRASVFEAVQMIEANEEARGLFARYGGAGGFGEDFLPAFAEAMNAIDADGAMPSFETTMTLGDGSIRTIRVHYRATADANGAPWSMCLGAYDDVTEARRAVQVQEEARLAAEAANRTKSDFLARMSHEIRTPLNGVLGMAQAMDLEHLEPRQRERLKVIRNSGGALLDLLDDLLDIARIDAGRLTLRMEEFDLQAVVRSAHGAFAAQAAAKGLSFPLDLDPDVEGLWRGDAGRLRQILTNLISNGVKFTERGQVSVQVRLTGAGVRIEVADTGIGIAPDRIGRLFEKFVQADESSTRAYGGTGLGLAICQELSRAMDGSITATSATGMGSTFALDLPLGRVGDGASEDRPAPLTGALASSGLRVLAAEDNDVNRIVLKTLLSQLGIEATLVENGAEAVRAWESAHWDMILMDVQMPVMDGPTATMTIRARETLLSRPRTPILAVTANTMPHQVASYRAAGMDNVVAKPLNVRDLLGALIGAASMEEAIPERIAS